MQTTERIIEWLAAQETDCPKFLVEAYDEGAPEPIVTARQHERDGCCRAGRVPRYEWATRECPCDCHATGPGAENLQNMWQCAGGVNCVRPCKGTGILPEYRLTFEGAVCNLTAQQRVDVYERLTRRVAEVTPTAMSIRTLEFTAVREVLRGDHCHS